MRKFSSAFLGGALSRFCHHIYLSMTRSAYARALGFENDVAWLPDDVSSAQKPKKKKKKKKKRKKKKGVEEHVTPDEAWDQLGEEEDEAGDEDEDEDDEVVLESTSEASLPNG